MVIVGQVSTVLLMVISALLALFLLENASQAFEILLLSGAGSGAIYLLRWFWWRINAYTEIVAMVSSLVIAYYFNFINTGMEGWQKIVIGAILTTIVWVAATFITPADNEETLRKFVKKVNPGGPGWEKYQVEGASEPWPVPQGILNMLLGCMAVYGFLLGVGQIIYGNNLPGMMLLGLGIISGYKLKRRMN